MIAFASGYGGLLGALLIALCYPPTDPTPRIFVLGGIATGAIGGAVTLPAVVLCGEWLSPLASSTLLWSLIGFLVGLIAHRLSTTPTDRSESAKFHSHQLPEWMLVRLLPLLAVVSVLLWVYCVLSSTRY